MVVGQRKGRQDVIDFRSLPVAAKTSSAWLSLASDSIFSRVPRISSFVCAFPMALPAIPEKNASVMYVAMGGSGLIEARSRGLKDGRKWHEVVECSCYQ